MIDINVDAKKVTDQFIEEVQAIIAYDRDGSMVTAVRTDDPNQFIILSERYPNPWVMNVDPEAHVSEFIRDKQWRLIRVCLSTKEFALEFSLIES